MKRRRLVKLSRSQAGFTLIEILIVMLVISIAITFIAIRIDTGMAEKKQATGLAKQMQWLIQYAQENAVLTGDTLGVNIEGNNYYFMRYNLQHGWLKINDNRWLRSRSLPNNYAIKIATNAAKGQPHITLYASGELSPFNATFYYQGEEVSGLLGTAGGEIKVNK